MSSCKHARSVNDHLLPCQPQLRGYENRLSEIKGCCGLAVEGDEMEEDFFEILLSLSPPPLPTVSLHTALRIAIETFLLITTETSFPSLRQSPHRL